MKTIQTLPVAMMLSGVIAGEYPSMPGMKNEAMPAPKPAPTGEGGMGGGMGSMGGMGGGSNNCPPCPPAVSRKYLST